jgi:hypothetical protein
MGKRCEDCGCHMGRNGCENCNEAGYILDQYDDLKMDRPESLEKDDAEYRKRMLELGRKI